MLLLRLREPSRQLERPHSTEGVSTEYCHHRRLVQIARWRSDRFQSVQELRGEFGDRDMSIDREDSDGLSSKVSESREIERGNDTLRLKLFRPMSFDPG